MAGGEGVLTAWVGGGNVLTVWATKGHMEELHSFNVINFRCPKVDCDHGVRSWIGEVQVIDQSKIALLLERCKGSLVFLKRGEQGWEEKIVACFPFFPMLAAHGHWVALVDDTLTTNNEVSKVMLWQEENTGQDIELPFERDGCMVRGMVMELPFLALILCKEDSYGNNRTTSVKVYRMAEDKQMKDLSQAASLVKSISINNFWPMIGPLSNRHFVGFVHQEVGVRGGMGHVFKKSTLFSNSSETGGIQIHLPTRTTSLFSRQIALNTTSLVFYRREKDDEGRHYSVLAKKDFWMTN